jgi:hypothetical protein
MDDLLSTVNAADPATAGNQPPAADHATEPGTAPELEPGWYSDEFKQYISESGK